MDCHSERNEESRIVFDGLSRQSRDVESLASCFAFRCSTLLNHEAASDTIVPKMSR